MTIYVKIEFEIDDNMAYHAVEHLLNSGEQVSKKKVIELCRMHLAREGNGFMIEPIFDTSTELNCFDQDVVSRWFEKIWK
jgi:hypothetical protein